MKNLKLTIAYEGTSFLGWQKTRMGPSIEEELEKTLSQILQHPVNLQAASRTDAGVHAEGQVVNFFTDSALELPRLQKSLNGLLPKDISVLHIEQEKEDFHPTLDCTAKEYHYHFCLGSTQLPFRRRFSWHYSYPVDLEAMRCEAKALVGKHDFSAFTNEKEEDCVREIFDIEIFPDTIRVVGNRFLYKMVRNIVGTLIYIGSCKLANLAEIIESKDRTRAGMTAPAHGLILKRVIYNGKK